MTLTVPDPDLMARRVWLMLTVVGAILCVVGWLEWMNLTSLFR
jgi:hypothetical protein